MVFRVVLRLRILLLTEAAKEPLKIVVKEEPRGTEMIRVALLCVSVLLSGCATTTTITTPDQQYVVECRDDALVTYEDGDLKVQVDNRGRPSFLETFFSTLIMKTPDVTVNSDN